MKTQVIGVLVIFVSVIVKGDCGIVDSAYGKVKNTTEAVKDDIKGWWSYGKDLIFGEDENAVEDALNSLNNTENVTATKVNEEKGMISGAYHGISERISAMRTKLHDLILGENKNETEQGLIRRMYENFKNRLTNVKTYVFGGEKLNVPQTGEIVNIAQNNYEAVSSKIPVDYLEKTKAVREALLKFINNDKNKDFGDKLASGFNNLRKNAENVKNNTETGLKDAVDRERDMLKLFENKILLEAEKKKEDVNTFLENVGDKIDNGTSEVKESVKNVTENIKELTSSDKAQRV